MMPQKSLTSYFLTIFDLGKKLKKHEFKFKILSKILKSFGETSYILLKEKFIAI